MKTFRCEFLGCKVNQYDAERARRHLLQHGYQESDENASLLLLASCTVTGTGAKKGRQAVRSALRRHPQAQVAVLGCYTPQDRRQYESIAPEVTFLPSSRSEDFLAALTPLLGERSPSSEYRPRRTRAYLKVEDGCDLSCAFCIIPSVRGRARSRSPAEVAAELQALVDQGTREIVLTGVHLGHYGRGIHADLGLLLRRLLRIPGEWRLRLSSLEVSELSAELLDLLEHEPRLVPHLHLPLQSGSPQVLRSMRRPYSAQLFRDRVAEVYQRLDRPSITTDIIVGFPGETEDDFQHTLEMAREACFAKIHVFPYSPRQGTAAATLPDPVPGLALKERKSNLMALERDLREQSYREMVGYRANVIVERLDAEGRGVGVEERYHEVLVSNPPAVGEVASVEIGSLLPGPKLAAEVAKVSPLSKSGAEG
jgi:threonylcarbamoyladenosine tRNA methylthiotransferase MtaB